MTEKNASRSDELEALRKRVLCLESAILDVLDPRCIGIAGRLEYFRDTDRSRAALTNLRAALAKVQEPASGDGAKP